MGSGRRGLLILLQITRLDLRDKIMNLKQATIFVLVCLGLSLIWALVCLFLPPSIMRAAYDTKLPALIFIAKDITLLTFFAILLKNQVVPRE